MLFESTVWRALPTAEGLCGQCLSQQGVECRVGMSHFGQACVSLRIVKSKRGFETDPHPRARTTRVRNQEAGQLIKAPADFRSPVDRRCGEEQYCRLRDGLLWPDTDGWFAGVGVAGGCQMLEDLLRDVQCAEEPSDEIRGFPATLRF
ncbi:MAG TPA: hypothetical protein PLE54_09535 [Burkholderiaceae bacterium]|nr:hypothetical protein [Burkholderiaceae bacterium]HQR70835.1 hypothetical protein [Burkholderiaceae bacterium]